MRIFLLLILLMPLAYGTKVLTTNIQVQKKHLTLTLTFDTPYENSIVKSAQNDYLIVHLKNIVMEYPFMKENLSSIVKTIVIQSQNGEVMIIAKTPKSTMLNVTKSKDGFALRLKYTEALSPSKPPLPLSTMPRFNLLDYLLLFFLALIGIVVIYKLLKKKKPAHMPIPVVEQPSQAASSEILLSVRFEKEIDSSNRALLLRYHEKEYPIILGETNLFLSSQAPITSQEAFEALIQQHLNDLNEKEENASRKQEEPIFNTTLESYKEKASGNRNLFDEI